MDYRILKVGNPIGTMTLPIDNRLYQVIAEAPDGTVIKVYVPVCFTKLSVKKSIETMHRTTGVQKIIAVKEGEIL